MNASRLLKAHGGKLLAGAAAVAAVVWLRSRAKVLRAEQQALAVGGVGAIDWGPSQEGLLLKAVMAGEAQMAPWVDVPMGDLTISVAQDCAKVGGLRLGCSWNDTIKMCDRLGGNLIAPSQKICDAMYAASNKLVFRSETSLGPGGNTHEAMIGLTQTKSMNENVDTQIAAKGQGKPNCGAWKFWILNALLDPQFAAARGQKCLGAVNYGGWDPKGSFPKPPPAYTCGGVRCWQSPAGTHGPDHSDSSQAFQPVKRDAKDSNGNTVDLLEWIEVHENVPRKYTDAFRFRERTA